MTLGTAVLFIVIYTAVVYIADGHRRILLFSGAFVLLTSVVGYRLFDVIQLQGEFLDKSMARSKR